MVSKDDNEEPARVEKAHTLTESHSMPACKPETTSMFTKQQVWSAWQWFFSYTWPAYFFLQRITQRMFLNALSMGPLPKHIAFIMDGNRRWSRAKGFRVQEGHRMGFEALRRVLELCMALGGVQMVTVFAFAINNFKRSEEEVDALMALAKARLLELYQHGEVISRYSVRVRVVGKKELLPADVQEAIMTLEKATCHNTGAVLNICMPYSSQDEMCQAYASCVDVDQLGECTPPITRKDLDDKLLVSPNVPVDLLIRTSKVHRLSDFLLWQCNEHTQLHFVDQYWPMFGAKELIPILLQYQRCKIMGY